MNQVDRDPEVCGPIITGSRTKEESEKYYRYKRRRNMVNVSGDLLQDKEVGDILTKILSPPKSIYPLCYCKVCQGETKHKDCPNQDNPRPRAKSIWFRALHGEAIYITREGIR